MNELVGQYVDPMAIAMDRDIAKGVAIITARGRDRVYVKKWQDGYRVEIAPAVRTSSDPIFIDMPGSILDQVTIPEDQQGRYRRND